MEIDYALGDIIQLKKNNQGRGRVCFIGETSFAMGKWVGLELLDVPGEHDGEVKGKRYFKCEKGKGVFVKPSEIKMRGNKIPDKVAKQGEEFAKSASVWNLKEVSNYHQLHVASTEDLDHEWELSTDTDVEPEDSQQSLSAVEI